MKSCYNSQLYCVLIAVIASAKKNKLKSGLSIGESLPKITQSSINCKIYCLVYSFALMLRSWPLVAD